MLTLIFKRMNNRKTAGRIQLALTFLIIVSSTIWILSITLSALFLPWLQWCSATLTVITLLYFITGGFYYIELSKPDDHFEIRFYNSFPFSREFKMLRIPISAFIKFDIEGSALFKRKLILYQMSANQMAKYPSILITAFTKNDINNLHIFFNKLK